MKVSGIDEDFVNLINVLNENGLRPYSSCDGVESHHTEDNKPIYAYVGLLRSKKGIDLLAACLRDKSDFEVCLGNNTHAKAYELYGNEVDGNVYLIFFYNEMGERTDYFEKIVNGVIDGSIHITDSERENLVRLDKTMEEVDDSDLAYRVILNGRYQPFTGKYGATNKLSIFTKDDLKYDRDMHELAVRLSKQFGIYLRDEFSDAPYSDNGNFIIPQFDRSELVYYFQEDDLSRVIEMIKFSREQVSSLPTFVAREFDDDEFEL